MKPYLLALAIVMFAISSLYAQEENPLNVKIIPPAPEAASLGKFVDMPVSAYTGLPKIEIPIYQLKSFELTLPISLTYHASGIRMEELASFVGAGWALNAGGIVSRTIRGFHDEYPTKGYLSTLPETSTFAVESFISSTGTVNYNFMGSNVRTLTTNNCPGDLSDAYSTILYASRGGLDLEPDLFFFSLPDGQSGKFLFSRNGSINFIPKQYVNLTKTSDASGITSWTIIGKDGTKYVFANREGSQALSECSEPSGLDVEPGQPDVPEDLTATSTWRNTMIISASGRDTIFFEYAHETLLYEFTNSTTRFDRLDGAPIMPAPTSCATQVAAGNERLTKIRNSAGYEVEFIGINNRQDITTAKKLDRIVVKYKGVELKAFDLTHGYFGGGPNMDEKMLSLESVRESSGGQFLPSYDLTYYPELITGYKRSNPNVDHWGYSNGETRNLGKSPQMIYNNEFYPGADRFPRLEYCRQWTLKEIKYPTGGRTEFEYDLHEFTNVPSMASQTFQFIHEREILAEIDFTITSDINADYSQTIPFTLTQNANVAMEYVIPVIPGGGLPVQGCNGVLKRGTTTIKNFNTTGPAHQPLETLIAGNYTLSAVFDPSMFNWQGQNIAGMQFTIRIYKIRVQDELMQNNALKGGGLRIKKITSFGDNTIVKSFDYTNPVSGLSSGKIMAFPQYATLSQVNDANEANGCVIQNSGTVIGLTASSNLPLTQAQGSYVGYDVVTEYHGTQQSNNGYSVYNYINIPDDSPTQLYPPTVPTTSYSFKSGLLTTQTDFTTTGKVVKEVTNDYRFLNGGYISPGVKVAQILRTGCRYCPNRMFNFSVYEHYTERIELGATTTRVYDIGSNNFQEHKISFYYDGFDQVDYTEEISDVPGKKLFKKFKYDSYDHTAVTEKYSYYATTTNGTREYKEGQQIAYHPTYLKPTAVSILEPVAGAVSGEPSGYVSRLAYTDFDTRGNVTSYLKENAEQTRTSLIWAYNKLFPVAQAVGAPVNKIAHTSFEDTANKGGWSFQNAKVTTSAKIAGEAAYDLNGNPASTTGLVSAVGEKYLVSFWSTIASGASFSVAAVAGGGATVTALPTRSQTVNGTVWTLHSYVVTITTANTNVRVATTAPSPAIVDELRVHPVDVQMTTYTYSFKHGMTSSSDVNNFISYYEYDSFSRLSLVKDFAGNILKKIDYHYERNNP